MKKIILVHGMQRSGNHAIVQWISAHERFIFRNNVIPIAPILDGKSEMPQPERFETWFKAELRPPLRFLPFSVLSRVLLPSAYFMASLEDHTLDTRPFYAAPLEVSNALIIRDAHNMFASRLRRAWQIEHPTFPRAEGALMDRVIANWKSHAREFLGLTNILNGATMIHFDRWFANKEDRQRISESLGLPFTDAGFSVVSNVGGGSSFDGTKFDGEGSKMQVLDRKDQLDEREREVFEAIFADQELCDLAEQVRENKTS